MGTTGQMLITAGAVLSAGILLLTTYNRELTYETLTTVCRAAEGAGQGTERHSEREYPADLWGAGLPEGAGGAGLRRPGA